MSSELATGTEPEQWTFSERCTDHPGHFTLDVSSRNTPAESVLEPSRHERCPVCGAPTEVETEPEGLDVPAMDG